MRPSLVNSPVNRYPGLLIAGDQPRREFAARHSHVAEFAGAGNGASIIVKTITTSVSAAHAAGVAGHEFAALGSLRQRLGERMRDTIPEPLAWVPGTATIVMSKLDGVPVGQLLRRYGTRATWWAAGRLEASGERVGQWLREMHDDTRAPAAPLETGWLLAELEREARESVGHGWSPDTAAHVLTRARAAAHRLAGRDVPRAARQGDFSVSNILIDDGVVRVVDFENYAEAADVYEDITAFTSYLRVLASSPIYSPSSMDRMRCAFLRGYGQAEDDAVLRLYELKQAVSVLAHFDDDGSMFKRLRRRRIGRSLAGLARALEPEAVPGRWNH